MEKEKIIMNIIYIFYTNFICIIACITLKLIYSVPLLKNIRKLQIKMFEGHNEEIKHNTYMEVIFGSFGFRFSRLQ